MTDHPGGDAETPVEQRLLDYILSLQADPPRPPQDLTSGIVRTARWQSVARPYLEVAGGFGQAAMTAIHVLLQPRRAL
jgi:hypothetical protein